MDEYERECVHVRVCEYDHNCAYVRLILSKSVCVYVGEKDLNSICMGNESGYLMFDVCERAYMEAYENEISQKGGRVQNIKRLENQYDVGF